MKTRTLSLRRDVVVDLTNVELRAVGGGASDLCSRLCSDYAFVSCNPLDCLLSDDKTICLEA